MHAMVSYRARVSVVIPSKNRPAEIVRALTSIRAQPTQPAEIIVVDQSAEPYQLEHFDVRHIHEPTLDGLTAARNRGIEQATADYLIFIDDDCLFVTNVVEEVTAQFDREPRAIAVQPRLSDPDYRPPALSYRIFEHGFFKAHIEPRMDSTRVHRLSGGAMAYRRELFERERFDERLRGYGYGEDWDFSLRAGRWGALCFAPAAVVEHRSPVKPVNRRRALQERWDNFGYLYRKLRDRQRPIDRLWYLWWMTGETLQWLRAGYGFPETSTEARSRLRTLDV